MGSLAYSELRLRFEAVVELTAEVPRNWDLAEKISGTRAKIHHAPLMVELESSGDSGSTQVLGMFLTEFRFECQGQGLGQLGQWGNLGCRGRHGRLGHVARFIMVNNPLAGVGPTSRGAVPPPLKSRSTPSTILPGQVPALRQVLTVIAVLLCHNRGHGKGDEQAHQREASIDSCLLLLSKGNLDDSNLRIRQVSCVNREHARPDDGPGQWVNPIRSEQFHP